jgi:hypothetical protein
MCRPLGRRERLDEGAFGFLMWAARLPRLEEFAEDYQHLRRRHNAVPARLCREGYGGTGQQSNY